MMDRVRGVWIALLFAVIVFDCLDVIPAGLALDAVAAWLIGSVVLIVIELVL